MRWTLPLLGFGLLTPASAVQAVPVPLTCQSLDVEIRSGTGGASPPLDEAHGCPGPLSAQHLSGIDGNKFANLAMGPGSTDHSHIFEPQLGDSGPYFRTDAVLTFTAPTSFDQLQLVPMLIVDGPSAWNARVIVIDQTANESHWFFSGSPIFPNEADDALNPPIASTLIYLTPGHSYLVSTFVQTAITAGNRSTPHSTSLSLGLELVPEPATGVMVAAGLVSLAAFRHRRSRPKADPLSLPLQRDVGRSEHDPRAPTLSREAGRS